MDFDHCISFKYHDYTGDDDERDLYWEVEYQGGGKVTVLTKMIKGVARLEYLEYLIAKGGRFVDDANFPIRKIWGSKKEMMDLLYGNSVISHS